MTEWIWSFYIERTADGREDRTRTSSEHCRKSRRMSRVVVVLAFNAQNLRGHVTLATPTCHNGTFPTSMRAKLEVRNFRHFGATSI